jgi:hypothetical protein
MSEADTAGQRATIDAFIAKWRASGGAERANYVSFLTELCTLLDIAHPDATKQDEAKNRYVFEKAVTFQNGDGTTSRGWIDLYKADCFVLEAKQGTQAGQAEDAEQLDLLGGSSPAAGTRRIGTAVRGTAWWTAAMDRARAQAERYARALPEWPPFLIVVDVGHSFALFANFARDGKAYLPFPDARSHRFALEDLADPAIANRLRRVWTEPMTLDPGRYAAEVTQKIAARLAALAKSLEAARHHPQLVADFLMRCLFTMFAEDVGLIPKDSFTKLLTDMRSEPAALASMLESLWHEMDRGGFSPSLRTKLLRFNGRFFKDATAIQLSTPQIDLLIDAARTDWSHVEPAIFGTLLERALDPAERHALGAHFTPRAYVERLVFPTVIEPLREEWQSVKAAALALKGTKAKTFRAAGKKQEEAVKLISDFRRELTSLRVLDPACGTGNFLYVTLEHMKRLEGEVLEALADLDAAQETLELRGQTVDPHQFLGIEKNPRAAAIAELVLWIGYLQWHFRTLGRVQVTEPVLRDFKNIECRDAVLAYDAEEVVVGEDGKPVTVWDGETTKTHPVTGKQVPDETARKPLYRYVNARKAEWPDAAYVVSNPPFLGTKRMRAALGDGYVDALRRAWSGEVEDNADFVMYWWNEAGNLVSAGKLRRFGFITTNSITQTFNRRVLVRQIEAGVRIAWAVPNHPWVDSTDGADVRVAMTCADANTGPAMLLRVVSEGRQHDEAGASTVILQPRAVDCVHADLSAGANVAAAMPLRANSGCAANGVALHGAGFIVEPGVASALRAAGDGRVIRPFLGGRDLLQKCREQYVIDFSGMSENAARQANASALQHLVDHVLPERKENRRKTIRELWWRFGWERPELRRALSGLRRYMATTETAKHRIFQFIESAYLCVHKNVVVASDDAFVLGNLCGRPHILWSIAAGGRLGVGDDPVYAKSRCFDPFPFPAATEPQQARIRELAEALDAHRKRQQAAHPDLTLTNMYNVLEKLRSGEALTAKEKKVHEQGLCSILLKLHDDLDAAVFDAYGWPTTLTGEEILERLVALNAERVEEEKRGLVRWLRPDFQRGAAATEDAAPAAEEETQDDEAAPAPSPASSAPWPSSVLERVRAVRAVLATAAAPLTLEALAATFAQAPAADVGDILAVLVDNGQVRQLDDGRFAT